MALVWPGVEQGDKFVADNSALIEARWKLPSAQFITSGVATDAVKSIRGDAGIRKVTAGAVDPDLRNLWGTSGRVPRY